MINPFEVPIIMKIRLNYLIIAASTLLAGCVFAPKEVTYFDEGCDIEYKKKELNPQKLIKLDECNDMKCAWLILAGAMLTPPTAIVSGSIVVVSNTVHWIEKQGDCEEIDPLHIPIISDVFGEPEQPAAAGH